MLLPSIHIRKGLPFSFEIGARGGWVEKSRMGTATLELKWALNEGFTYLPDIGVRGNITKLLNSRDFDLTAGGLDIGIGKQFAIGGMVTLTPYVGWNLVFVGASTSNVDFNPNRTLAEADTPAEQYKDFYVFSSLFAGANTHNRFYGGIRFIGGVLQLGGEISYSAVGTFKDAKTGENRTVAPVHRLQQHRRLRLLGPRAPALHRAGPVGDEPVDAHRPKTPRHVRLVHRPGRDLEPRAGASARTRARVQCRARRGECSSSPSPAPSRRAGGSSGRSGSRSSPRRKAGWLLASRTRHSGLKLERNTRSASPRASTSSATATESPRSSKVVALELHVHHRAARAARRRPPRAWECAPAAKPSGVPTSALRELPPAACVATSQWRLREAIEPLVVADHQLARAAAHDVELDAVGALLHGEGEGLERVLRSVGARASVAEDAHGR